MRSRKNNKKIIVLVVILLLLSMGIGYAYLTKILKINNTANIAKTTWDVHFENVIISEGSIERTPTIDESKTSVSLSVNFVNPGDFYEYTVDVVNGGTIDAMVSTLSNNLTEEQERYLEYTITYIDDIKINSYDLLLAGKKDTIKVRISLKNEGIPENLHFTIETGVNYVQKDQNGKERKRVLFSMMKKMAIDDTDINFGAISSDTNGKGVYHLTKIKTSAPIYYYRGEVDNNVLFGGFCWKIIRTTETGGVKLIYNGEPNDGVCDATGDATEIGKSAYNKTQTDPKYAGYMYDNNTVDSTIKSVIDEWFRDNLLSYQTYLEDTPFYNERDYVSGSQGWVYVFSPAKRIFGTSGNIGNFSEAVKNTTVKLGAMKKEDIFTISSEIGNGELTYPVGLITSDEAVMAGGKGITDTSSNFNTKYYLWSGSIFWTLSPANLKNANGYNGCEGILVGNFLTTNTVTVSYGVRPVVSLKPEIGYMGGNGTKENPYIITE